MGSENLVVEETTFQRNMQKAMTTDHNEKTTYDRHSSQQSESLN